MSVCDEIVVLHRGKVIVRGLPEEVAADPEATRAYYGADA